MTIHDLDDGDAPPYRRRPAGCHVWRLPWDLFGAAARRWRRGWSGPTAAPSCRRRGGQQRPAVAADAERHRAHAAGVAWQRAADRGGCGRIPQTHHPVAARGGQQRPAADADADAKTAN